MRKLIAFGLSLLSMAFIAPQISSAALVYRPGQGFQRESEDSGPAEKNANAQLAKARDYEVDGKYAQALGAYKTLLKFKNSGVEPFAQFKIAEMHEKTDDKEQAFKEYGKYISKYPNGRDFDTVVERQFNIAKAFMGGERRRLMGVKTFGSQEKARKMFQEIVKNAPYSKYAPLAQFNIGMTYEKGKNWAEAVAAYQVVLDKYPGDAVAADAQYQIGYVQLRQIKKGSNDLGTQIRAHDAFEDFVVRHPQSEKVRQAKDNLNELKGVDVKKTLATAKFYQKSNNPKAAAIYYSEVIHVAPNTPEGKEAKVLLEKLRKTVGADTLKLAEPAPAAARFDIDISAPPAALPTEPDEEGSLGEPMPMLEEQI